MVDHFEIGDRVRMIVSGWTGTITKRNKNPNNGYYIEFDAECKARNPFGQDGWVRPVSMEKIVE